METNEVTGLTGVPALPSSGDETLKLDILTAKINKFLKVLLPETPLTDETLPEIVVPKGEWKKRFIQACETVDSTEPVSLVIEAIESLKEEAKNCERTERRQQVIDILDRLKEITISDEPQSKSAMDMVTNLPQRINEATKNTFENLQTKTAAPLTQFKASARLTWNQFREKASSTMKHIGSAEFLTPASSYLDLAAKGSLITGRFLLSHAPDFVARAGVSAALPIVTTLTLQAPAIAEDIRERNFMPMVLGAGTYAATSTAFAGLALVFPLAAPAVATVGSSVSATVATTVMDIFRLMQKRGVKQKQGAGKKHRFFNRFSSEIKESGGDKKLTVKLKKLLGQLEQSLPPSSQSTSSVEVVSMKRTQEEVEIPESEIRPPPPKRSDIKEKNSKRKKRR